MSVLDQFKLEGQVAVITGGGRGIGEAIALDMAEMSLRPTRLKILPMAAEEAAAEVC